MVDDIEESCYGSGPTQVKLGMYTFVSCWTKSDKENLALWNMYTRYKGVRIGIDEMPFKTYRVNDKFVSLLPSPMSFGQKTFWKGKSKDAYAWAMGRKDAAEWIGFVGYEMRRDGALRIRKKSFRKELDKQISVVFEKTLDKIKDKQRVSNDSLMSSLESKLISMSVGKISVWNASFLESEMCWSAGFKELEMNPVLAKQLRELDRHRWMLLNAANRRIEGARKKTTVLVRKDLEQQEEEKNPDSHGMVHSYFYQFAREK